MAIGIGTEASTACSTSSDVDLYRYKYRESENQVDGSSVDIAFVSPVFSVFERHRFTLLRNSKIVHMTPRWMYRPDYLSFDEYGTTAWWQMLLWINDVKSIEYFTISNIIIPDPDTISRVAGEAYLGNDGYIDINEDEKHQKTLFTLFKPPENNLEQIKNSTPSNTLTELVNNSDNKDKQFVRELFNLTIPMLRLRHIDLKYKPIENSIKMIANCRPNLIYSKHYLLIEDNNKSKQRITWDPEIINNAGLLFKLKENDTLEVQYVTYID